MIVRDVKIYPIPEMVVKISKSIQYRRWLIGQAHTHNQINEDLFDTKT